jgi:heme/copper-type cytochrome/quinol oxidase subunit 4
MTVAEAQASGGIGKYLVIYICILGIAGLQFVVAYQNIDTSQMLLRMLSLAILEAALAVLFFMHMATEKRGFMVFVAVITFFVLATLNYGWTDSSRMLNGVPYSPSTTQSVPAATTTPAP